MNCPRIVALVILEVGMVFVAVAGESPVATPDSRSPERLGIHFSPAAGVSLQEPESSPLVMLPKFEVRGDRIDLTERDVLTSKELIAQAKEKYLSGVYQKTIGQVSAALGILANLPSLLSGWHPNDAEATILFAEDERLRQMKESKDLIELIKKTDPAAFKELKKSLDNTFQRIPPIQTRRGE